jgi:hypothetical protein
MKRINRAILSPGVLEKRQSMQTYFAMCEEG